MTPSRGASRSPQTGRPGSPRPTRQPGLARRPASGRSATRSRRALCPRPRSCSGSSPEGLTDVAVDQDGARLVHERAQQGHHAARARRQAGRVPDHAHASASRGASRARSRPPPTARCGSRSPAASPLPTSNAILRVVPATLGDDESTGSARRTRRRCRPGTPHGNVWFTGSEGAGGTAFGRLSGADGVTVRPAPPTAAAPRRSRPRGPARDDDAQARRDDGGDRVQAEGKGDSISANQICVGPPQDRARSSTWSRPTST